jgi:hypothetical protein
MLKDGLQEAYDATESWRDDEVGMHLAYLTHDVLCTKHSRAPVNGWFPASFFALAGSCPSLKKLLKRRGYTLT